MLDVKWGSGAFMKTPDQARSLADSLVTTGTQLGLATTALISDMNQPLGRAVGNLVEVLEVLDLLKGEGPADVRELTLRLAEEVLKKAGCPAASLEDDLTNGRAMERFEQMVRAQGGDLDALPEPAEPGEVVSASAGYVDSIASEQLGHVVISLGGGRQVMSEPIDPLVGMEILVRIGDRVEQDQPLARLYTDDAEARLAANEAVRSAITLADTAPSPLSLVVE